MSEAKKGDVVQLAKKEGILIDYESGFEIHGEQKLPLGEKIGKRTKLALQSGGLLVIKAPKQSEPKTETAKKPATKNAKKTEEK